MNLVLVLGCILERLLCFCACDKLNCLNLCVWGFGVCERLVAFYITCDRYVKFSEIQSCLLLEN